MTNLNELANFCNTKIDHHTSRITEQKNYDAGYHEGSVNAYKHILRQIGEAGTLF